VLYHQRVGNRGRFDDIVSLSKGRVFRGEERKERPVLSVASHVRVSGDVDTVDAKTRISFSEMDTTGEP
jgi:hypothetical protein